jgi:hypothetical protein
MGREVNRHANREAEKREFVTIVDYGPEGFPVPPVSLSAPVISRVVL